MKREKKIFYQRSLLIIGVLLGTMLMLTGCGKAEVSVKTYDKENEVEPSKIARVENTIEGANKVDNKEEKKNDETNTTEPTKTSSPKSFSNDDLVINNQFRLGESSKAIEHYYPNQITSVTTTTEDATGRDLIIMKLDNLGLEVENSIDENNPDGEMIRIRLYGNSKFKTARGIKIGDSKEKIYQLYKNESILDESENCITVGYPGDETVYESDKGKIYFTIENDKVIEIFYAYGIAE